jgi:hypothetical protein
MTMQPGRQSRTAPALADLRYLERITDFEDAIDHGPMSGKEILVYAPGKTGTVSLFRGIQDYLIKAHGSNPHRAMLHNHSNRHIVGNLRCNPDAPSREQLLERVIVRDLVDYKSLTGGELLVVSSYREPLSRAISSIFQQLEQKVSREGLEPRSLSVARCKAFVRQWLASTMEHFEHPLTEIEPDFFRTQCFYRSTRSCYLERNHYRILALTLPHVECWSDACERHLGWKGVRFDHQNNAEQKPLGALYRRFKAKLRLPASLIRRLYHDSAETEYLRWFFSAAEVDIMCAKAIRDYGRPTFKQRLFGRLPRSLGGDR